LTLPYPHGLFLLQLANASPPCNPESPFLLADRFSHDHATVKPIRTKILKGVGGVCSEVLTPRRPGLRPPLGAIICSRKIHSYRWKSTHSRQPPYKYSKHLLAATKVTLEATLPSGCPLSPQSNNIQGSFQQSAAWRQRAPNLRLSAHPRGCALHLNGRWLATVLGFSCRASSCSCT
jgi:hypothetical protein